MKLRRSILYLGIGLQLLAGSLWAQASSSTKVVKFAGTTHFAPGKAAKTPANKAVQGPEVDVTFDIPGVNGNNSPARLPANLVPTPTGTPFGSATFNGFVGLDQFQQAVAFTGFAGAANGQLEPPDQGLAVGNGFVVEPINNAIEIFDTKGNSFGFEALSFFFNLAPTFFVDSKGNIIPPFGPFLSDPRAYFDSVNGHFIVTELEIGIDPVSGNFGSTSELLIAVSQTNNPLGSWNIFTVDISHDGDARFGGCPNGCFGDQPLIGADANGFYVSTNAFTLPPGVFRGAQLYAISLAALEAGSGGPIPAVHLGNIDVAPGEAARSIQPATVPPGGTFESGQGGTEYFVNALDPTRTVDNRISVWTLTNTSSLTGTPALQLNNIIVSSEVYGVPPATDQINGPTPFRDFLATLGFKNHEELITDNNDRMQQVVFANGMLWTAVPTRVQPASQGPVRAGAAWFILAPSVSGGTLTASMVNQGYVSIRSAQQNSVFFPAIGVNAAGKAAIVFSIAGEGFFPSAAYATLDAGTGTGPIVVTAPGFAPDDGFSGYFPFIISRAGRWGDYSAAVADEAGNIWMATESINPPVPPENELPPGALLANFGTFLTEVTP
ncbi:MAG TPA: hypothetical protein VJN48_16295 [Terriglobales bacterium]|nr:hypothetical protein [Terriglobales bacterium]